MLWVIFCIVHHSLRNCALIPNVNLVRRSKPNLNNMIRSLLRWRNWASLLFLLSLSSLAFAQSKTVTGTVTDESDGGALPGATIRIEGTTTGTATDFEGQFSLSVNDGDVLIVSFVGYTEKRIEVAGRTVINIALSPSLSQLQEVVVIGYGVQEKRVATGSISKVTNEDIEGFNVASVSSALDGIVSGIIVNESSGQPGAGKSILIRGISTNGDNTPLYVVDGMQVGNIDNLNPNDIESIDVLKDAASSAIYGARAANGVIIITTKKGTEGVGEISYEGFTSVSTPWKLPEMLNSEDYVTLTREKFAASGQTSSLDLLGFPTSGAGLTSTDWMDEIFNNASVQQHSLTATMNNAFFSAEYWDQNGVVGGDKSNYRRYALRLNSTKEINEYVKVGENLYINRVENQGIGTNNAFGTVIADAFAYDPLTEVYDANAQYGFAQSPWVQKEYINPLSRLFLADNTGHSDNIVGNIYLEIKPIDGLTLHSDLGIDYYWYNYQSFTPDYAFHPAFVNVNNDVTQGYGFGEALQVENYLNYKKSWGDSDLDIVVGTSYRTQQFETAGGSTSSIPDAVKFDQNWQWINAGQDTTDLAFGTKGVDYRLISYYGRAIYNYKGKYLLTGTLRRDGSSNFGRNNRWGVFPSVSVGWIISDEDFFPLDQVSFMKIRSSWGVNGNDRISPLSFASRIENVFNYPFGVNPQLVTGAALATPPNPNIKWEESVQFDIGLEVRLFNDKLTTEFDFYVKNTKDLLMAESIPGYLGATNNPISNLGEIQNIGFESAISYRYVVGDLKLSTSLQYTTFKNNVVEVAGDAGFLNGWGWPVRNTAITRMSEGFPIGHFVGYQTLGVFQSQADVFGHIGSTGDPLQPNASPGDLIFEDTNNDGVINSDDIGDIGNPWPSHIFGLTLNAQYKAFDFTVIVNSQLGHDIYRTYERSDITFTNYQTFWKDRWTDSNPSSEYPRLISTDPNNNQRPSSFYVEDGSFLRVRNLQVGYSLSPDMLEKVKLKALRIYLTGNNLFTLTNYKGFDPEIGTDGWILNTGIDKGYYPSNRTFGAGIRVTM